MSARRTGWRMAAIAAVAFGWAAYGLDAPHNASTIQGSQGCDDCHSLHAGTGPAVTDQPDNFTLCSNCHNNLAASFGFGGKWYSSDQGTPEGGGRSHHWNSSTTNAAYGATPPTDPEMLKRARDGYLQCATCHNPHASGTQANAPYNLHISVATGVALAQTGGAASGATMRLTVGAGSPVANGYRIQIGPANNQFRISHDARNGWGAATWGGTYTIPGANIAVSLSQAGDDPVLSVAFSQVPTATGGYWDFYVSYPHLRMSIAEAEICLNCHPSRNQTHGDVETSATYGWASGKPFSHPVGEGLNANAQNYDLATPLDVSGTAQGGTPTSNYLRLSPTGKVTCLSCHAAHNADSNSQTVDAR